MNNSLMEHNNKVITTNQPETRWLVAYTRSNYEKKVDIALQEQGFMSYCPCIQTKRKWADRYKIINTPFFKSYIFVQVNAQQQDKVKRTFGIINYVSHCGKPVVVSDGEIERIKTILNTYSDVQLVNITNFKIGDQIEITDGPMADCKGKVIHIQGVSILMVMERLACALVIRVNQNQVALTTNAGNC